MFVRVDGKVPVTQDHDSVAGLAGKLVDLQDKRRGSAWMKALVVGLASLLGLASSVLGQSTVSTVNTGAPSVAIAVNPTQNIIYVTQGDNSLTYIDGWTHTVHKISDPVAAGTNGASAMATYLNGVYVLNSISNDITTYFILPNGGGVAQSVIKDPTAVQPVALVGNPNGLGSGYVVNRGSNTVSVFVNSGSGLAFSKSIGVGSKPTAIVVNLSTNVYYVANSGDGSVSVIDGATNTVVNTIDVGNNPVAIAVNPVTNKVYALGQGSNSITVFSGTGGGTNNINGLSNNPAALAINPLTNQIYVATLDGNVYVIDGSTDTVSTSVSAQVGTSPTGQAAVVVDPTTNIAFVSIQGGNLTAVNGNTFATSNPPVGPGGNELLALNPVTHRVYADTGSNSVAVVDGATNSTNSLSPGQSQPWAVAVNPATNRIYVANNGSNNVTVIDGTTDSVIDTVAAGTNPSAITVDPAKNLIFVTNSGDATVTIIDGATDHTITQPVTIQNPDSIAVDPVLERVHGASSGQNSGFNFASNFGSNGFGSGAFSNVGPIAVAVNPAAGVAYTLFTDGNLEAADEVAPHSFITTVCAVTASTPRAMDVNPVTNIVYVACSGKEVDAVVSASGFFGGAVLPIQDSSAISPVAVAVNPTINQIYVANAGDGTGNGSVTVIDGATNTVLTHISIGFTPVGIAVNFATGKVYIQAKTSPSGQGTVFVIDPIGPFFLAGDFTGSLIGSLNTQIAVNPVTSKMYAAGRLDNTVSTIAEHVTVATGPTTTIQPFPNNIYTTSALPAFTFTATSGLSTFGPYAVYFQVDSRVGPWSYAGSTGTAGTFSGTVTTPLSPGFHIVYAYSVSGDETNTLNSSNSSGFGYNPFVGAVASYGFIVAPANAGTQFYAVDYGTQALGITSAPQQSILINHGVAPLHFTYSITGSNTADFIEVPYTGTDTLCSSLGGVLPPGKYCVVNIAFRPSGSGGESAVLIFLDDSLGIPNSGQGVALIGNVSAPPLTATFSGITPSQSILAGASSITLGGIIGNGSSFPAAGESVLVNINNSTQTAIIGSNGVFTLSFPTAGIPASATPYPITYIFAGDATFSAAADSSTSLTVSPASPTLVSITIAPATPSLSVHSTLAFLAIGTFSDGSRQNLTSSVTWTSGTTSVATITSSGLATAVSAGTSTITATTGIVSVQTPLVVSANAPFAYIGSVVSANCCLDVINTSNNQLVATIPVTTFNQPLGLSPDQTRIYVPDNVNNLIDAVDATTNILRNAIPAGPGVTAGVITPDGNFGYVADLGDNNVWVFNGTSDAATLVTTIAIGFPAGWISVTPDGSLVYAGSSGDNRVAVIDTKTNSLATTISLAPPPGQLTAVCIIGPTFNAAGTLGYFLQSCASNTAPGFLTVLSIPSNAVVATIPLGIIPYDLALTPDGSQLYVANARSNTVSVVNTSTNTVSNTIPVGNAPQSLAVTPDGSTVYVANTRSSTVSLISTSSNTVTSSFPLTKPFGIVMASPPPVSPFVTTLILTPSNLLFGSHIVSTTSAPQTISVKNPGAAPVTLTSISLIGPNIADYSLVNSCPQPPATLAAGSSCNLQFTFRPLSAGARVALVAIQSNNGVVNSKQSAPLSGIGTGSTVATFSALTPSQAITVGAASVPLSGVIGNGTSFPVAGETVAISINGVTQNVSIGSSGAFSTSFPTTAIPASATPYAITYNFAGDSTFTSASNSSTTLTVNPVISNFVLTVSAIGTGNGTVTDNLSQINCTSTAGVQSGTCSASYPAGTVVSLTAAPVSPSTFAAWGNACTGSGSCSVTLNSPQSVTASFAPPPQMVTLNFNPGTNVAGMATYDCPSNPNPSPANPCLDPNAHAVNLAIPQVLVPFSLTVQATEVPPSVADGLCPNGATPSTDFDCRFASFFTYQTLANGDRIVPLCYPYANGNCIHYLVFSGTPGVEPNPNNYVGPIDWTISWNNDLFVPPAPYTGSTPRVYDDPDYAVSPTSPFGTDCNSPMLVGNPPVATAPPIFCQFEFDITTGFNPNKKVDAAITARTKQFNDVIVAFPPANTGNLTVTTTAPASVTAGSPFSFSINVTNSAGGSVAGATLSDVLPSGTNISWSISPAYTGPGTCAISGGVGNQVLTCTFGTINPSQAFSISLLSSGSSVGTFTSTGVIQIGNQQILSIGTIAVQPVSVVFSGLTPSQSIFAGTSSITLGGIIGNGTSFPSAGESVLITINNTTQNAIIGSNGVFTLPFPTANLPASVTPYPITYTFSGDSIFSAASDSSTSLLVNNAPILVPLTVNPIGTGNGTVTDNLSQINCTSTAGVQSGTCSASYPAGTVVSLTAAPVSPSTFAAWGDACTGTGACSLTLITAQTVTTSFVPPPQMVTLNFTPTTNATGMATYDCPSNPNPSPANPCLDPNAHAVNLAIPQVLVPFSLTVQATEVPPSVADGLCPNGATPSTDFDCRFASFFTYQTLGNGDRIVPLCYPYANGNCIHYLVFSGTPGVEPNPNNYVGPIDWTISWNNDQFVPPAPYSGSTPRVYDDPDYAVSLTSPFGTDCNSPMLVGNPPVATAPPIFCQFEFDITTGFNPNKKVDAAITARTKQFNDVIVAFPPANTGNLTVTTTTPASVTAGSPISFSINVTNSAGGSVAGATLSDTLPSGTNISWSISPAYTGPGTCAISGGVGNQVLTCSFGTINPSQAFSISLLSSGSSVGTFTSTGVIQIGNQQILSIGTIAVQPIPVAFSGITPSQSIFAGTSSVMLGGIIGNGTSFPSAGESVLITINNTTQNAIIGNNGVFTLSFPTANLPASVTPYPITYSFSGDAIFSAASDSSTSLTVNSLLTQTITFGAMPSSAAYDSTFAVSATASSGLPVTISATGACSLSNGIATITSGTGTCTLTALQPGNSTYAPAQSVKTVTVSKATTQTTISSTSPNPSNVSQPVVINFVVTGITTPSGSVSVASTTGESCTGTLTAGAGSCSITFATAGPRSLVANYGGDSNFSSSISSSVSQTVNGSSASNLLISPTNIDFGQVQLGSFSARTVTLSNNGKATIANFKISLTSAGPGEIDDFHFQSLCPKNLATGKSCKVLVEFAPDKDDAALAMQAATLLIGSSATGSPQSVSLTAVMINPRASFSPSQLNFSGQKIGTTGDPQTVTLTNTGTSPLILQSVSTAGDYALVAGTTCVAGTILAPTQNCTLAVTFTPRGKRLRLGGITITDNTLLGKELVLLTGVGN